MKKCDNTKDDLFKIEIINEVENEDGSATWTIEYDERFLSFMEYYFNVEKIEKVDMERYFLILIRESIKGYGDKLTEEDMDNMRTD